MSKTPRSNRRYPLLFAVSFAAFGSGLGGTALAQDGLGPERAPASAPTPTPAPEPVEPRDPPGTIVVIGDRAIIAMLKDLPVEQEYDEQDVASYGANSVGEVIDAIRDENGDEEPAILVNGRPVTDRNDISDLPPKAIARIETLPRGAAQRVGGAPGQRAYNVVLKRQVRSAALTSSYQVATEGGWNNARGEVQLTSIQGQNRLNLTMRGARSGNLLESERDFVPRPETTPFAPLGNVIPSSGNEVDPALSALAGRAVTVVGLPAGLTTPTLAALAPGGNLASPSGLAAFRTLRGTSRPYEIALSGNRELTEQLSLSFNGRLSWLSTDTLTGLPSARFLIPAANPFTPFSRAVSIALNDPARPLRGGFASNGQSLSTTFNALLGDWRASVTGRYDRRVQTSSFEFTGQFAPGAGIVAAGVNPFAGTLGATIPVGTRVSRSRTETTRFDAEAEGPLAQLWAGPLAGRMSAGAAWTDFEAQSDTDARDVSRREFTVNAGLTLPLTGGDPAFLPGFGESELAVDLGRTDVDGFGSLQHRSLALNWQLRDRLRIVGTLARDERAIVPELLSAPTVVVPDVEYFDPLTGDTVTVTAIYGGAPSLDNEVSVTRSLSLTATPLKRYNLQLDAAYTDETLRNQIGALPLPSAAIVAAFPDRFQRDAAGTLIVVDSRSVNFASQRSERLRLGVRFTVPLSNAVPIHAGSRVRGAPRTPRPKVARLQINAAHTVLLSSVTTIRPGLPEIDLLDGGAIGIGGGRLRHTTNASAALSKGATGLRVEYSRRGASALAFGTLAAPGRLSFGLLETFDLKAYTDLADFVAGSRWAKGARLSLAVDNLFNRRQRVTDQSGQVPQAYQPVRRDPLGRTVTVELRKAF